MPVISTRDGQQFKQEYTEIIIIIIKMVALIILIIALQFDVSTSCNDSLR